MTNDHAVLHPWAAGQVAVITGAAQGIGAETARRCAAASMAVIIGDIDGARGEILAEAIRQSGGQAVFQYADVSLEEHLAALVQTAAERWGRLDLLVNNAHWEARVPVTELTQEQWDRSHAVLLRSHILAAKHAVPLLRAGGGGSIINISSIHGLAVTPHYETYEAHKASVIHLTRGLARDLGPDGIRVNGICPGLIITERLAARYAEQPGRLEQIRAIHPVRRLGTPADITETILWLASPAASFITGQSIVVDGGITLQMGLSLANQLWDERGNQASDLGGMSGSSKAISSGMSR